MYTTLFFPRGIQTPVMQEIEELCRGLNAPDNAASAANYGSPTISGALVSYTPDGVSCNFRRRLANIPDEMSLPSLVRLELTTSDLDTDTGIFRRRGSVAIVETSPGRDGRVYMVTVEARTLRRANNLMDDVLNGRLSLK